MPACNPHHLPNASLLCDCHAHQEARRAVKEAGKVVADLLEARKNGRDEEAANLAEMLEILNATARQCDE